MIPIVVYTKKRIFRHYTGFSFFIFIWISRLETDKARLIRHETIHFRQQVELLFVFHWLLYVGFYLISRLKGHEHYISYRHNPFELEAYENDLSIDYLKSRKIYSWIRYVGEFKKVLRERSKTKEPGRRKVGWD